MPIYIFPTKFKTLLENELYEIWEKKANHEVYPNYTQWKQELERMNVLIIANAREVRR